MNYSIVFSTAISVAVVYYFSKKDETRWKRLRGALKMGLLTGVGCFGGVYAVDMLMSHRQDNVVQEGIAAVQSDAMVAMLMASSSEADQLMRKAVETDVRNKDYNLPGTLAALTKLLAERYRPALAAAPDTDIVALWTINIDAHEIVREDPARCRIITLSQLGTLPNDPPALIDLVSKRDGIVRRLLEKSNPGPAKETLNDSQLSLIVRALLDERHRVALASADASDADVCAAGETLLKNVKALPAEQMVPLARTIMITAISGG